MAPGPGHESRPGEEDTAGSASKGCAAGLVSSAGPALLLLTLLALVLRRRVRA